MLPWSKVGFVYWLVTIDQFGNRSGQHGQDFALALPIDVRIDASPIDPAIAKPIGKPLVGFTT